ncbi:META domain-containing protein [Oceanibaculum indicum]|uniref:Heat shock protein HslJ n=1 Tax=Oceanibaculum indicum TaxID=526216 RepID=A0A420WHE5_9PROT|nr:META domain-containing protein [Oceanibaculum indicum]RKQ70430.1 heat shock protein HslJ [Oceanibaculum indicum]
MRPTLSLSIVALGLTLAACATDQHITEGPMTPPAMPASFVAANGLSLPGNYAGVLPCADCPGIKHGLTLRPDQSYALRRTYLERNLSEESIGRWHADPARRTLILGSEEAGTPEVLRLEIMGNGTLRLLDRTGQPIASTLPYELTRQMDAAPLEPVLPLRGAFTYMADAPRLTECRTGNSYPVAMEGEYLALERAYLAAKPKGAAPLTAEFKGALTQRPRMDGPGNEPTILVQRFDRLSTERACDPGVPASNTLANGYWRLIALEGEPVAPTEGGREPYLLLLPEPARYAANAGCNQIAGGYRLEGDTLRFGDGLATRMACPEPAMSREAALTDVLKETATWRIDGDRLSLLDEAGRQRAQFLAVYRP